MPAAPCLLPRLCPSRYQRVQSVPCSRKLDHSPSGLVQGPYVCGVSGTSWVLRGKLISCCEQPVSSCGSLGHIWLGASRLMLGQGCGARQEVLVSKSGLFFLASIKSTFHSGRLGVGEKYFVPAPGVVKLLAQQPCLQEGAIGYKWEHRGARNLVCVGALFETQVALLGSGGYFPAHLSPGCPKRCCGGLCRLLQG